MISGPRYAHKYASSKKFQKILWNKKCWKWEMKIWLNYLVVKYDQEYIKQYILDMIELAAG